MKFDIADRVRINDGHGCDHKYGTPCPFQGKIGVITSVESKSSYRVEFDTPLTCKWSHEGNGAAEFQDYCIFFEHEFRLAARKPKEHRPSTRFAEENYASFLFWDEKNHGDEFTAYVRRGTPAHQKLSGYLIESTPRALIVRLRRHPLQGVDESAIEVTEFVTEGWVRSRW